MAIRVRGWDDQYGREVELVLEGCWRCGALVNVLWTSLTEHVERAHPVPPGTEAVGPAEPRHALNDDRRVPPG